MSDQDVLRQRARLLARPVAQEDLAPRRTLLRLRRAGNHLAVDLGQVRQVARLDGAAWLPRQAWPLVAIAPLGDQIVPVLDLGGDGAASSGDALGWGVAVASGAQVVFLRADEVTDVVEIREDEIAPAGPTDSDGSLATAGITRDGDALVDLDAVLAVMATTDDPTPSAATPTAASRSPTP